MNTFKPLLRGVNNDTYRLFVVLLCSPLPPLPHTSLRGNGSWRGRLCVRYRVHQRRRYIISDPLYIHTHKATIIKGHSDSLSAYVTSTAPTAPVISDKFRTNAKTIEIFWDAQTLDETRGFLTQYDISYIGGVNIDCEDPETRAELRANNHPETRRQLTEKTLELTIDNLKPGWEYCVGVAGTTAGGLGPFNIVKLERKY